MNKSKAVIILGSSNSKGNTYKVSTLASEILGAPIVDLKTKQIGDFDYEFNNINDDFFPLIEELIDKYELFIMATPVYWYTMSAVMKRFFDRFSDLLKIHKDTGRNLRGKKMAVISCGSDKFLKEGFQMPFVETAKYLGMHYVDHVHIWMTPEGINEEAIEHLLTFSRAILNKVR